MFPFPVYRSSEYISIYTVPYYVYTCWEFLQQSTDKYIVYQATSKYIRKDKYVNGKTISISTVVP